MPAIRAHVVIALFMRCEKGRMNMASRINLRMTVLLACGLGIAAPAVAQNEPVVVYAEPQAGKTELVRFADLDLRSTAGTKRLAARVGGAIERVCEIDLGRDGLQDRGYYACADQAWSDVQPRIGQAILAAQSLAEAPSAAVTAIAVRAIAP